MWQGSWFQWFISYLREGTTERNATALLTKEWNNGISVTSVIRLKQDNNRLSTKLHNLLEFLLLFKAIHQQWTFKWNFTDSQQKLLLTLSQFTNPVAGCRIEWSAKVLSSGCFFHAGTCSCSYLESLYCFLTKTQSTAAREEVHYSGQCFCILWKVKNLGQESKCWMYIELCMYTRLWLRLCILLYSRYKSRMGEIHSIVNIKKCQSHIVLSPKHYETFTKFNAKLNLYTKKQLFTVVKVQI